ncbi:MAG: tRNA (adenosine(37)-N6)-threonylcarbamoyltransferase complex ATPase subunit type 1 TsaE [Planctomycetota bacterium]|jgi:tRNA threonylcarbamoyladenosine biosynthesis protein TsaE|nr:tRNA (adenosine(37)-N6)-threonylcarbamoyltransferase complex ATPase subunit type 1 TsaE [Planctomycetota bacterium]
MTWLTKSPAETRHLAQRIGALLQPEDVVVLIGDLGAGKTTFVQGLALGLGIDTTQNPVTSPTYQIMRHHNGPIPLFHYDAYRLENAEEFGDIEGGDHMGARGVVAIEWGERIEEFLPTDTIRVEIRHVDQESRAITLQPGERSSRIQTRLELLNDSSV